MTKAELLERIKDAADDTPVKLVQLTADTSEHVCVPTPVRDVTVSGYVKEITLYDY